MQRSIAYGPPTLGVREMPNEGSNHSLQSVVLTNVQIGDLAMAIIKQVNAAELQGCGEDWLWSSTPGSLGNRGDLLSGLSLLLGPGRQWERFGDVDGHGLREFGLHLLTARGDANGALEPAIGLTLERTGIPAGVRVTVVSHAHHWPPLFERLVTGLAGTWPELGKLLPGSVSRDGLTPVEQAPAKERPRRRRWPWALILVEALVLKVALPVLTNVVSTYVQGVHPVVVGAVLGLMLALAVLITWYMACAE